MKYALMLLLAAPAFAQPDFSNIFNPPQPRQGNEIVVIPIKPPTVSNPFPQQYMVFENGRYETVDPLGKPSGRIGGDSYDFPGLANPYGAGNAAPASKDGPVFNNFILGQGK